MWPPVPCSFELPGRRKGKPYILVTRNEDIDHGDRAKVLAVQVCHRMITWVRGLTPTSIVSQQHWERMSFGHEHAEDYSVFMDLAPVGGGLDRETTFFALSEYRSLLGVFGAMQGEFEIWSYGRKRISCRMHVFEWPPERATE